MIGYLIALVITGLIVGALGRLAVPGPNPMSIGMTILCGIGGAFLGGLIGAALGIRSFGFILAVLCAAGIVYLVNGRSRGGVLSGRRRGLF